ncbi:MAG: UDP-N-acetylmuramoyl-tripeptide--D-alanyl-D-alanine ligase [Eubacterium sp.]|nr:UDP-N-acetylmuramoyl-tripeptide--D-alanyl-D-alanine ligase [Eubacterium sp.]
MKNITIGKILEVTGGKLIGKVDPDYMAPLLDTEITDIATDSRDVKEGILFVAFKGEKIDAHKFIPKVACLTKAILTEEDEEMIKAGADGALLPENVAYIKVDSTIEGLQKLGAYVRGLYPNKVIGVTGSVGKTTTREMITCALSSSLNTYHTIGNMNSQVGVPVMTSRMLDQPSDISILEMGISIPGEMDRLAKVVKPDIGVVTVIGVAHIEFLKTREGIREEKLRIASQMDENGVLFLNADDPLLWEMKGKLKHKVYFYGTNPEADFVAEDIRVDDDTNSYTYRHGNTKMLVTLNVLGVHNVLNSLVSLAIADYLGLDLTKAATSLENFEGLRQRVIKADGGYTIIDDTYNASPDSMKAALKVLQSMDNIGNRIAVLGDMFELGPDSGKYHKEVGEFINTLKAEDGSSAIHRLITIGNESSYINQAVENNMEIESLHFNDKEEASDYIKKTLKPGDAILFKASNGMKFKEIVSNL